MPDGRKQSNLGAFRRTALAQILAYAIYFRKKRGQGIRPVTLDDSPALARETPRDIIALDEALQALNAFDPRKCQIVELRFFGGLTVQETAKVLDVSPRTVLRE